jgi:protein-S-isoprenylcysteine O-methyltransferase Ste14
MSKLELKIPPVLTTVVFAMLMWLVSSLSPGFTTPYLFRIGIFTALIMVGAFFSVAGVVSFRKAKTSVNPITPDACTSLVTSGIYKSTRNPMYLGFLFFLIGWGLYLSNLYSLMLAAGFIFYITRFQILPEEQVLQSFFGTEYLDYKNRVRRWL